MRRSRVWVFFCLFRGYLGNCGDGWQERTEEGYFSCLKIVRPACRGVRHAHCSCARKRGAAVRTPVNIAVVSGNERSRKAHGRPVPGGEGAGGHWDLCSPPPAGAGPEAPLANERRRWSHHVPPPPNRRRRRVSSPDSNGRRARLPVSVETARPGRVHGAEGCRPRALPRHPAGE